MTTKVHTPQQYENWKAYERVRARGRFNMFDPAARRATGLSREDYLYVMKHYASLKTQGEGACTL
jgi:hypothetical protein